MGTLYIVATPIGNREDITIRALRILFSVDVVACEDTRRTGLLLNYYQKELIDRHPELLSSFPRKRESQEINGQARDDTVVHKPKLISFYDEVEEQKIPEIIEFLKSGKDVALVSDAGTPLISDPGFKLVRECHRQHIPVSPIPGPSSITAALSVSGLPTDKFLFVGYLPKKKGKRKKMLEQIKSLKEDDVVKTVVFLETPHRINEVLGALHEIMPDTTLSIANELTKMYERIAVISLPHSIENPKGEYVVLV